MRFLMLLTFLLATLLCITGICNAGDGKSMPATGVDFSKMSSTYEPDVLVVGGGPSGVAAAIAAARNGAQTLLIEQYGFLGGMGTAADVAVFMPYRYSGGIFREMLARLDQLRGRKGPAFDVNLMKVTLDQLTAEAGVQTLLYTRAIAVVTKTGRPWRNEPRQTIAGVVMHNKSGLQMVKAKTYIDCTGDADIAAWSGVPFEIGRVEDGETQPMTMCFRMGGCTFNGGSIMDYPGMEDFWASYAWNPNPGEVTLNMTRVKGFSGINGEDLSQATIAGRQAVMEAVEALKKNVPGFENAYLIDMPAQIGVRETRRIVGATVLTGEQIIEPKVTYAHRRDVIARCNYDVDIHDPNGTKAQIIRLKQPYEIPYRCLLPKGVDNLLVAGRPVSADHVAHSSLRIQPNCYALGQAAGTAAALVSMQGHGPWELGGTEGVPGQLDDLQRILLKQGADLGPTCAKRLGLLPDWRRWQVQFALEAFPTPKGFKDIPPEHPAYKAVMALAQMGVFRGVSETEFGAETPVTLAVTATVISRALATLPSEAPVPASVQLPQNLQGQWWTSAVADCAGRGILVDENLDTLDVNAQVDAGKLARWLDLAFSNTSGDLTGDGTVSRSELAQALWVRIEQLTSTDENAE